MLQTAQHFQPGFKFRSVSRTHPGKLRLINEDRILDNSASGLWAVADGMGGHHAGDQAASRLIEALQAADSKAYGYVRLKRLIEGVDRVNASLFNDDQLRSGSTLVALLAHESHLACLWAGDSRGYLLRDGALMALTHDHSLVQQLVDQNLLSESDRTSHPNAHIITRAVGASPSIELEQTFAPIHVGDMFFLCSDGLTACLSEDELARALDPEDISATADTILAAALSAGAPDNISFVIASATCENSSADGVELTGSAQGGQSYR